MFSHLVSCLLWSLLIMIPYFPWEERLETTPQYPQLSPTGHCDPNTNGCTRLSSDNKSCQDHGIKVVKHCKATTHECTYNRVSIGCCPGESTKKHYRDPKSIVESILIFFIDQTSFLIFFNFRKL